MDETPELSFEFSGPAKNFIQKCLTKKAKKRLSAREMLEHPWIVGVAENVQPKLMRQVLLRTASSMQTNDTQQAVLSFLQSYKWDKKDQSEVGSVFMQLNRAKDGCLTRAELKEGMKLVNGKTSASDD